jgi:hypothetical protein
MSTSSRLISTLFTALPGFFFFILFLQSGWLGREYWWETYLVVLIVLLTSALVFGFILPIVFQKLRLGHPWIWILVQGLLSWTVALIMLGLLPSRLCAWVKIMAMETMISVCACL